MHPSHPACSLERLESGQPETAFHVLHTQPPNVHYGCSVVGSSFDDDDEPYIHTLPSPPPPPPSPAFDSTFYDLDSFWEVGREREMREEMPYIS